MPPLIDARARVLILGSFPSTTSLTAQQYYAHPQNLFWRILGEVIGRNLCKMDYAARCRAVQDEGIAIWDIYACCTRPGSMDAAIRDAVPNDLAIIKTWSPDLRSICFNGRTAARRVHDAESAGYAVAVLPSTSPANAGMPYAEKLERWSWVRDACA